MAQSNIVESLKRELKAIALADILKKCRVSAKRAAAMTDEQWLLTEQAAKGKQDVRIPSQATRQMVIDILEKK